MNSEGDLFDQKSLTNQNSIIRNWINCKRLGRFPKKKTFGQQLLGPSTSQMTIQQSNDGDAESTSTISDHATEDGAVINDWVDLWPDDEDESVKNIRRRRRRRHKPKRKEFDQRLVERRRRRR